MTTLVGWCPKCLLYVEAVNVRDDKFTDGRDDFRCLNCLEPLDSLMDEGTRKALARLGR